MKLFLRGSDKNIKAKLVHQGVLLTTNQVKFLKKHDGHQGLVIADNRMECKTCGVLAFR